MPNESDGQLNELLPASIKILHVSTVHLRNDVRIFLKEAEVAFESSGGSAAVLVADGRGDQIANNKPSIFDASKPGRNRLTRFFRGSWLVWRRIRSLNPKIVHIHDPELIPLALYLKARGYKVIYDAHEDLPRQIELKHWIVRPLKPAVSMTTSAIEWGACRVFDKILAATPTIAKRFPQNKTCIVYNFPLLSEFNGHSAESYAERKPHFAYLGGISPLRGTHELLAAFKLLEQSRPDVRLDLAGNFTDPGFHAQLSATGAWHLVNYVGYLDRDGVQDVLGGVRAGLVTLHPTEAYMHAYPVKMFEYMAASLPVIASDFPLLRQILEEERCGLLVDPLNPQSIAEALNWVLDNPEEAKAMGERGRALVESSYNWKTERRKLSAVYEGLLAGYQ